MRDDTEEKNVSNWFGPARKSNGRKQRMKRWPPSDDPISSLLSRSVQVNGKSLSQVFANSRTLVMPAPPHCRCEVIHLSGARSRGAIAQIPDSALFLPSHDPLQPL